MDKKIIFWYSGASVDADYQSVLDRGTALGYSLPSATVQAKQNILIKSLKSGNIWSSLDILYIFATDGDQNFSLLNWKSPTLYKCSLGATPPIFTTKSGWNGNSVGWLDTGWNPSTNGVNYQLNNASFVIYSVTNTSTSGVCEMGLAPSHATQVLIRGSGSAINAITTVGDPAPTSTIGTWILQRTASNLVNLIQGTSIKSTGASASTGLPNSNTFICARNYSSKSPTDRTIGIAAAGDSLSGKESALNNALTTYINSL